MPLMHREVYDAFRSVGVEEPKAQAAAEALAKSYTDHELQFTQVKTDLGVLKWMVGTNMAMTLALIWRAFTH